MENQITTPPVPQPATSFAETGAPKIMSVKEWLITLVLMIIPMVNIILLFVWAFGDNDNKMRSNWAKAYLIMVAIAIVLSIFFFAIFGAMIVGLAGGSYGG